MKPTFKVQLEDKVQKHIEDGSIVTSNSRIGLVIDEVRDAYSVFNIKLCKNEIWKKETTKPFKGKIIMQQ